MSGLFSMLNEFGSVFCEFSFEMLVQSSVLIIVLYLIDVLIRKRVRAVFRYCIWMLVFVKLVLPVSLSSPMSIGQIVGDRLTIAQTEVPAVIEDYKGNNTVLAEVPAVAAMSKNLDASGNKAISSEWPRSFREVQINAIKKTEVVSPESSTIIWQAVVFLVWLVGLLVLSVLLFQRLLFVKSLLAQSDKANGRLDETLQQCCQQVGVSRDVELRLSKNMLSPAVCGLFRPIILMPASLLENLSRQKLRAVLIHELAHVKRGDLWVNFMQTMLQIFYFYNPLLWFANSVVRGIREKAVDEMVLTKLGDEAKIYSGTLIDIAEIAFSRPYFSLRLVGVIESKKALAGRIKHIINRPVPKSAKLGMVGLAIIIIAAGILLPMAKAEYSQPEFIIKGRVTDAGTGQPIVGAKVGDCERYNGGKFFAVTDSNGNYEYKTWYEEHGISAEAGGYESGQKGFNTKLFGLSGSEQERVIDFALEKTSGNDVATISDLKADDLKADGFKAALANGVTVELVGVCEHPSEGKQWWRPDGNLLEKAVYKWHGEELQEEVMFKGYEFVARIEGGDDIRVVWDNASDAARKSISSGLALDDSGKRIGNKVACVALIDKNVIATSVKIGVTAGDWKTEAVYDGQEMRYLQHNTGGNIIFSDAQESDDGLRITVSDGLIELDRRLIVVDSAGKVYDSVSEVGGFGSKALSSISGDGIRQSTDFFPKLKLKQVKEFQFQ
ncbi:MAG TPA: M56 family metallopeptidase, partial [Sedimentisphaerales bacterium]|nr:M56 family metallopeptidase [Sedimentisphaerales bacterium]